MSRINAILTVDALVTIDGKSVALIRRAKPPCVDRLVMPGGHVDPGEELVCACARELKEEIGLEVSVSKLSFLAVLDAPDRDPRPGRRISVVYHVDLPDASALASCTAASDAREIVIRPLASLVPQDIGFDHWRAIACAQEMFA